MAITLIQATPGSGMTLDIGRLAPVPDRFKFAPSNGALHLDQVQCSLRSHAQYLIEAGVRA